MSPFYKYLVDEGLTVNMVFAVTSAAFGSAFQHGYNTGVVNAPQAVIENFISETYLTKHSERPSESTVTLIFSIMVSVYCVGGMVGALGTAFFADRFGRKGSLLLNNVFVFIAAALMGFAKMAKSYEMLIIGRLIVGANSGLNAGLSPMYLTEISPVNLRGGIGTIYQLIITITILLSQILGMPELLGTEAGWPILFGLIIFPAILQVATLPLCPESPKYNLIIKEKDGSAQDALKWLRGTTDVQSQMDEMKKEFEKAKALPKVTLKDMVQNAMLRKPLIIAIVVMLSQQLSGINAVIFYSTSIFMRTGFSRKGAVYATLVMGAINVLMTVVSMILVEKTGRKTLLLLGLGGSAIVIFILTVSMSLTYKAPELAYVSVLCVIVFIILFASGLGSIPWFLVNEIFGQSARPLASAIAVSVNWMANFVVSIAFLPIAGQIGEFTFLIFVAILTLCFLFTYFFVPETKGKTIEEITAEFQGKSSD